VVGHTRAPAINFRGGPLTLSRDRLTSHLAQELGMANARGGDFYPGSLFKFSGSL
jgi:hypothetical protein